MIGVPDLVQHQRFNIIGLLFSLQILYSLYIYIYNTFTHVRLGLTCCHNTHEKLNPTSSFTEASLQTGLIHLVYCNPSIAYIS